MTWVYSTAGHSDPACAPHADVTAVSSTFTKKTGRNKLWRIRKIKVLVSLQANGQNRSTIMFTSCNLLPADEKKAAETKSARSKRSSAEYGEEQYGHRININKATGAYANQLCSDLSILWLQGWTKAQIICFFFSFYSLNLETALLRQCCLKAVNFIIYISVITILLLLFLKKISKEWRLLLYWD